MLLKRGYREPEKHDFDFWTEEEDATLIKAYPLQTADELQKLFPNRTMNAISKRARNHNLRKSPEVYSAIQNYMQLYNVVDQYCTGLSARQKAHKTNTNLIRDLY